MISLATMKRGDVPARADGVMWVYVICAGEPAVACKVGVAIDLYLRLKRTAYSFKSRRFPIRLYCAYALPAEGAARASLIEAKTHGKLLPWAFGHSGADWFLVRPDQAESALLDVLRASGVPAERFPSR